MTPVVTGVRGNGESNRLLILGLLVVIAIGGLLRAAPVIANGFPLNDGGLFLEMIRAVRSSGFALPDFVYYNGNAIPFAYPPLGFYAAAAIAGLSGASDIQAIQILPVVWATATIPAAYLLFTRLLETEFRALVATAAFAVIPRSYNWMVSGGGITRGLGMLAAITALTAAIDLYRAGGKRRIGVTGGLIAVTALAHPQAGVFLAFSLAVLLPFFAPSLRVGLLRLVAAVALAAVFVVPWLALVISRHGIETVVGAAETGGSLADSVSLVIGLRFSDGLFEVVGIIAAFGVFVATINQRWLIPVWLLVTLLVSTRAGLNYAPIMMSAAVAFAIADGLRLLRTDEPTSVRGFSRTPVAIALVAVLGVAAVMDSAASGVRPLSPLHGLDRSTRNAMNWIRDDTPQDSVVLVASGTAWYVDAISEWLPALAERRSTATVQGTEWLGPGAFHASEERYLWLQSCIAGGRDDCVAQWESAVERVDYVLAVTSRVASTQGLECCLGYADLLRAKGATVVFRGEDVIVLQLHSTGEQQ